jgi:hypothetical protein
MLQSKAVFVEVADQREMQDIQEIEQDIFDRHRTADLLNMETCTGFPIPARLNDTCETSLGTYLRRTDEKLQARVWNGPRFEGLREGYNMQFPEFGKAARYTESKDAIHGVGFDGDQRILGAEELFFDIIMQALEDYPSVSLC